MSNLNQSPPRKDWGTVARNVLFESVSNWLSQNGLSWSALPTLTPTQTRSLIANIDKAYPFKVRKYWPYKVWLNARKAFILTYLPQPTPDIESLPLFNNPS